jgi:rhodanese-related sulfurtransferase
MEKTKMTTVPLRRLLMMIGLASLFCGAQDIPALSSRQASEMLEKSNTYLIDVRTIAEYVYVGHPLTAYSVPLGFWDEKGIKNRPNTRFEEDLKALFKQEDVLIFICRSGGRSRLAAERAVRAGFKNVFNVSEGFEGGIDSRGLRTIDGWKNAGLPYTYNIDPRLIYKFR